MSYSWSPVFVRMLAFSGGEIPDDKVGEVKSLISGIVALLQETIGIINFWGKPGEVKKLRGEIDTEILLSEIPELVAVHERLAVEIMKLAEKRHAELTR